MKADEIRIDREFVKAMNSLPPPSRTRGEEMRLEDRLAELRGRATPEPWSLPDGGGYEPVDHEGCAEWPWYRGVDAELAYLAVNSLPALEELLRASRRVIADVEEEPQISPISAEFDSHWQDFLAALAACDSIP